MHNNSNESKIDSLFIGIDPEWMSNYFKGVIDDIQI